MLREEIDEVLEKLLDQLSVLGPSASLQFVPSEFSLGLTEFGHIAGQTEEPPSSSTSVILDQGDPTTTGNVGEVNSIFIWTENYSLISWLF